MKSKAVSGMMLILLVASVLALAFDIQPVKASGTIYIRADGSIEGTTDISTVDNITYTFTDNIYDEIVVERNNIVVDGAGYTLQGKGVVSPIGIYLSDRSNVTIRNMRIKTFCIGIWLQNSLNNSISGNNITNNGDGIGFYESSNNTLRNNNACNNTYNFGVYGSLLSHYIQDIDDSNTVNGKPVYYWVNRRDMSVPLDAGYVALVTCTNITVKNLNLIDNNQGVLLAFTTNSTITKNKITNNHVGSRLWRSSFNTISGNNIIANNYGIRLAESSNNGICHNSFVCNTQQVYDVSWDHPEYSPSINVWDDGYPSGGNYWSDHDPPDLYSGPYQNETGRDGIGDTPYIMDGNNTDMYPLIYPYGCVPSPDVNDDEIVNIQDIVIVALAFGSSVCELNIVGNPYNLRADVNSDGIISIIDLVMVAIHFGETW